MSEIRLTVQEARAAWLVHQRFAQATAPKGRALADLVGDIGWIPMTSPVTPYLSLFARGAITRRAELDDRNVEVTVVPGPRGTSWLVPVADAPLARAFAVADHASREARIAAATTLTSRDLEGTRDALRTALATPASVEEIKNRLAPALLRSLGDPGRKAGMPTVAAMVLRHMWVTGEVIRVPEGGRLDSGAARWAIDPHPRTVPTAADAVVVMAPRWLGAYAPVSARSFAAAFGIAAGRANGALKEIRCEEVQIEGADGVFLAPAGFTSVATSAPSVRFLPLRDPLTDVLLNYLATPDAARASLTRTQGVGPTVLVDGEVIGSWLYDPAARRIEWRAFAAIDPSVSARIDAEAERTVPFLRDELLALPLHAIVPRTRGRVHVPGAELSIEM